MFPQRRNMRLSMVAGRYTEFSTGDAHRGYVDTAFYPVVPNPGSYSIVTLGSLTPANLWGFVIRQLVVDSDGNDLVMAFEATPVTKHLFNFVQLKGPTLTAITLYAGDKITTSGSNLYRATAADFGHVFVVGDTYEVLFG